MMGEKMDNKGANIGGFDANVLQNVDVLRLFHVFILQKKTSAGSIGGNVTHEIMDNRKNVIFRATRPRQLFSQKPITKLAVRNLRNVKLFCVVLESTNRPDANNAEATIYLYQGNDKKRVAHVEKFGGIASAPSYEIFNADRQTAFTIDLTGAKQSSNLPGSEYIISSKTGNMGSVLIKSGLNIILCTENNVKVIEKATLIAVLLAMDLLKTSTTPPKLPLSNEYTLQH